MDRYDPYLHRLAVREIVAAWVIAVTFLAALFALPNIGLADLAASGYRGSTVTVADTVAHDTHAL